MLRIWESIGQDGMHVRRVDVAQEGVAEHEVLTLETGPEEGVLVRVRAQRRVHRRPVRADRKTEDLWKREIEWVNRELDSSRKRKARETVNVSFVLWRSGRDGGVNRNETLTLT